LQILGAVAHQRLPEILRGCDVFILPSYYEGFAIVILEAMASGLAVITTTATAGPDIITEGREGWIFDPGDLDALIEKMRLCLKDMNAVRLMRAAARTTAEQHSWSRYISRLISNFETVSSQRKAKGLAYR
jgi:glycosyltransferase involved in cell wall biosynthesis